MAGGLFLAGLAGFSFIQTPYTSSTTCDRYWNCGTEQHTHTQNKQIHFPINSITATDSIAYIWNFYFPIIIKHDRTEVKRSWLAVDVVSLRFDYCSAGLFILSSWWHQLTADDLPRKCTRLQEADIASDGIWYALQYTRNTSPLQHIYLWMCVCVKA